MKNVRKKCRKIRKMARGKNDVENALKWWGKSKRDTESVENVLKKM